MLDIHQSQLLHDIKHGVPLRSPKVYKIDDAFSVIDDRPLMRVIAAKMMSKPYDHYFLATHTHTPMVDAAARIARALDRPLYVCLTLGNSPPHESLQRALKTLGAKSVLTGFDEVRDAKFMARVQAERQGGLYIDFSRSYATEQLRKSLEGLDLHHADVWVTEGTGYITQAFKKCAGKGVDIHVVDVTQSLRPHFQGVASHIHTSALPFAEPYTGDVPFACNRYFEGKTWPIMHSYYEHRKMPYGGVYLYNTAFEKK